MIFIKLQVVQYQCESFGVLNWSRPLVKNYELPRPPIQAAHVSWPSYSFLIRCWQARRKLAIRANCQTVHYSRYSNN